MPSPRKLRLMLLAGAIVPALLFCVLGGYALMQSRAHYEQRCK